MWQVFTINACLAEAWQRGVSHAGIFNGPTVANGIVYVAAEDGKLYALNATGRVLFRGSVTDGRGRAFLHQPLRVVMCSSLPYDQSAVTAFALGGPVISAPLGITKAAWK